MKTKLNNIAAPTGFVQTRCFPPSIGVMRLPPVFTAWAGAPAFGWRLHAAMASAAAALLAPLDTCGFPPSERGNGECSVRSGDEYYDEELHKLYRDVKPEFETGVSRSTAWTDFLSMSSDLPQYKDGVRQPRG